MHLLLAGQKEESMANDFDFDIVRTEGLGFSMMYQGEMIEVPIKFMRISEAKKLTDFVKKIVEKEVLRAIEFRGE